MQFGEAAQTAICRGNCIDYGCETWLQLEPDYVAFNAGLLAGNVIITRCWVVGWPSNARLCALADNDDDVMPCGVQHVLLLKTQHDEYRIIRNISYCFNTDVSGHLCHGQQFSCDYLVGQQDRVRMQYVPSKSRKICRYESRRRFRKFDTTRRCGDAEY